MHHSKQIAKHNSEKIVSTGCLASGSGKGLISTSPLGSCVAVIAYDKTSKTGGIAHVMLPGKSPKEDKPEENKYAENAIENLLNELSLLGASKTSIEICLIGGANILRDENSDIGSVLIHSVLENLKQQNLTVTATSLGGYERRSANLQLSSGVVKFTNGDKDQKILCNLGVNSFQEN